MIAVGQVRRRDGRVPLVATDLVSHYFGDRVPDLVVIVDRIESLVLRRGPALTCPAGHAHLGNAPHDRDTAVRPGLR
ncbi:hypothetical protein [Nocardia miyunensis]|uniref:hypothetical protein n=1 Tax=Nocardia miyunensis TaxID=282684 RepID=UPI00082DC068|nr:hypothetical protein [Nocardia miyunensis]